MMPRLQRILSAPFVRRRVLLTAVALLLAQGTSPAQDGGAFRPPTVPLVTHDPYFSVWSMADRLTDGWSKHWTGATHAMAGLVRIDGRPYRIMGPDPATFPPWNRLA